MQSFIKLFFMSMFAILMASCGAGKKEKDGALNDQKSKLEKLKKQQGDLNAEVKKLEADILKVDTAMVIRKKLSWLC